MKTALVCGAGGFIGSHLVKRLKQEDFWVRGCDLKYPEFSPTEADEFAIGDLREKSICAEVLDRRFDHVYQLAADMGGAGYLLTGEHDADVMSNSVLINLHLVSLCRHHQVDRVFYASSACVYPQSNQVDPQHPNCTEDSAYPADPDSEYGWEKLFSERLFLTYFRNYHLNVRIARFHNIFGPEGTFDGGREKAPAAICRKVAQAEDGAAIEIWGDGQQTRSFLYIDECLEGIMRLMHSNWTGPVNIGSDDMISIHGLAKLVIDVSGKRLEIAHVKGPEGVRGRNSDNRLVAAKLGWRPVRPLRPGIEKTYHWILSQVK